MSGEAQRPLRRNLYLELQAYLLQIQYPWLYPGHLNPLIHLVDIAFDQPHRESLHHQQLHLWGVGGKHLCCLRVGCACALVRERQGNKPVYVGGKKTTTSKLKTMQLTNLLHWDFGTLCDFVESQLSVIGWTRERHLERKKKKEQVRQLINRD